MGWERRGAITCFYHPRRVGGRVFRDYLGSGPTAQLAADVIAEARDRRAALVQARPSSCSGRSRLRLIAWCRM